MAISPNYGWAEPDNSSLVKNGAQDIRALGDAIDTSVWNVGYGQAGKNKIINGNFGINQRGFTSTTTSGTYGFDRFVLFASDGTNTYSAQTFTPGAAPVAGYESTNFARLVSTGQTLTTAITALQQAIEDVRTFAGNTVTVSFWAKASTGTPNVVCYFQQQFGSGGSGGVDTGATKQAITTSWARYSFTVAVPSVSGKTIGAGSALTFRLVTSAGTARSAYTDSIGIQSATIDLWGVQVEYGAKMTPFQTASGNSPQAELAMCQRYLPAIAASNGEIYTGQAYSTTAALIPVVFPVTARVAPTGITVNAAGNFRLRSAVATKLTTTAINFSTGTVQGATIEGIVAAGLVAGNATNLFNESSGTILFTGCEL
jgi:hypothetical protein